MFPVVKSQPSLPVRGAWIEMMNLTNPNTTASRSPCGERGLKSLGSPFRVLDQPSLPVRGAWIEIASARSGGWRKSSLPVRGAWIEIRPRQ